MSAGDARPRESSHGSLQTPQPKRASSWSLQAHGSWPRLQWLACECGCDSEHGQRRHAATASGVLGSGRSESPGRERARVRIGSEGAGSIPRRVRDLKLDSNPLEVGLTSWSPVDYRFCRTHHGPFLRSTSPRWIQVCRSLYSRTGRGWCTRSQSSNCVGTAPRRSDPAVGCDWVGNTASPVPEGVPTVSLRMADTS